MNWDAFRENEHNRKYISGHYRRGKLVLEIDRKKVTFKNRPWLQLSTHDKRKFENKLYVEHANERKQLVFLYL